MPTRHDGSFSKNASTWRRFNWQRITTWPTASTPWTWKTDLAMSKPIVVIVCMARSSESREPQQRPHPWHRCAGGGAVHSINSGYAGADHEGPICDGAYEPSTDAFLSGSMS